MRILYLLSISSWIMETGNDEKIRWSNFVKIVNLSELSEKIIDFSSKFKNGGLVSYFGLLESLPYYEESKDDEWFR